MGKVCAVPGCNSGSVADQRRRQADQFRRCTRFQIPKDLLLRKMWSDELKMELQEKDVVCELHFDHEDLNIDDDFTLINGEIIVSVRERITLKPNARPIRNVVGAYEKRKKHESELRLKKTREYYSKLPQTAKEKLEPVDESIDEDQCLNSIVSQDVKMDEVEKFYTINTDAEADSKVDTEYTIGEDVLDNDYNDNSSQLSNTDPVFGVSHLVEILRKSNLRQNWAWGEKDGDLFFTLIDFNVLTARCYLQVHSNMKITTFLCDKQTLVNFTGITIIKSFEDLTEVLLYLEKQNLCLGTGLSQKSRSETCAISTKASGICSFCLKEKTKLESLKVSTEEKCNSSFKSNILLKKKNTYCRRKLDEARKRIAELEKEMTNMEQNFQNKVLGPLPDIQKEIVNMFIKFADLEKNRIRYSREWIDESLVMYKKSTALYHYMRERGILPLPCSGSLRTQTGLNHANSLNTEVDSLDSPEINLQSPLNPSAFHLNISEQI